MRDFLLQALQPGRIVLVGCDFDVLDVRPCERHVSPARHTRQPIHESESQAAVVHVLDSSDVAPQSTSRYMQNDAGVPADLEAVWIRFGRHRQFSPCDGSAASSSRRMISDAATAIARTIGSGSHRMRSNSRRSLASACRLNVFDGT